MALWRIDLWRSCDALLLAVLEGMAVDAEPDAEPKPAEAEERGDGEMELGNEPREENWKENEVSQNELTSVERSGHDKGGSDSP